MFNENIKKEASLTSNDQRAQMNPRLYSFGVASLNTDTQTTTNKLNSKMSFKNFDKIKNNPDTSSITKNPQGSAKNEDNYSFRNNNSIHLSTVSEVKIPHEIHILESFRPAVSVKLAEKMSFQNPDKGKDEVGSKKAFASPNNKNSINPSAIGSVSFNPGSIFAPEKGSMFIKSPRTGNSLLWSQLFFLNLSHIFILIKLTELNISIQNMVQKLFKYRFREYSFMKTLEIH